MIPRLLMLMTLITAPGCRTFGRFDGPPNLPFPTLGGKHVWDDRVVRNGWRVQQHALTRHHRLIDSGDVRRAWGSYQHCLDSLGQSSVATESVDELVVLVHGAFRSSRSMRRLQDSFDAAGYTTIAISYASAFDDVVGHARRVGEVLDQGPAANKVHFVTHSLGGLVVRKLLDPRFPRASWRERSALGRVCMIFPPNQGATKANLWHEKWWFRMVFGHCSDVITTAQARALAIPPCAFAVIAGGRGDGQGRSRVIPGDDDGTVGVLETKLAGMADHVVLDVGHTFGLSAPCVVEAAVRFIRDGSLREADRRSEVREEDV